MFKGNISDALLPAALHLVSGTSVAFEGHTGIGKTAGMKMVGEEVGKLLGATVETVIIQGQFISEGDIQGLPVIEKAENGYINNATTFYKIHEVEEVIARGNICLLIIDEINRCSTEVMNELMVLALEREVGTKKFNKDELMVMVAVNPEDDDDLNYDVRSMNPAISRRFAWFEIVGDVSKWLQWATSQELYPPILEYIANNEAMLNKITDGRTFTCSARWHALSNTLKITSDNEEEIDNYNEVLYAIIVSVIGNEAGADFMSFHTNNDNPIITPEEIIEVDSSSHQLLTQVKLHESPMRLSLTNAKLIHFLSQCPKAELSEYLSGPVLYYCLAMPKDTATGFASEIMTFKKYRARKFTGMERGKYEIYRGLTSNSEYVDSIFKPLMMLKDEA